MVIYRVAILGILGVAILFVSPAVQQTYQVDDITGYGASPRGAYAITHGSLSVLGNDPNPTIGKLMDSRSGPDTHSKVCDWQRNGVNDRQVVWENRDDGSLYVAFETKDPDGYGGRCGNDWAKDPKERHQVQGLTGGNISSHFNH